MKKNLSIEIIAWLIIALLLYTGFHKLVALSAFRSQLHLSPWSQLSALATLVSWMLPSVEIIISLLLIWPSTRSIGFLSSFVLFGCFMVYIAVLIVSGTPLPCACGGIISTLSWPAHLAVNILYTVLSIRGYQLQKKVSYSINKASLPGVREHQHV